VATVQITVDSVDITDDIIFSDAEFTSAANGRAGTCKFRVRDSAHIYTLVTGKQVVLTIDGTLEWGGYISQVQRGYFFDAYDCRCRVHVVPRFLEVHGVDWNVLFQRRFIYNLSDPTDVQLTQYPADTFDSTVIDYYVANHLDLTGDGISTSLVEHVGTPSTDAPISGAAGWTWGQFMAFINFNVGAIWYIDPDRVLVYCDVDTPNAPYGISDDPGAGEIGCQNLEISFDGSELANDALVWGMGQGSQDPVFSRVTDSTSVSEHNLWQVGAPLQAIWKQTTADRTANSYVYGSPQNKRGGKDDAVAVRCTVYTPGFRVAQKVDFRSVVFGFEDVIPIRVLRITFPTQTQPKWELTISHAIDAPWTGFDFFPFDFLPFPSIPPPVIPPFLPPTNPCADFVPTVENPDPCAPTAEGPFYFLQSAETNHSTDSQYGSYSTGLSVTYNPITSPGGFNSFLSVGFVTPEIGLSTGPSVRHTHSWLQLPTTADLTTWRFVYNSSFGVGVGIFLFPDYLSDLGNFPGSTAADKYLNATPFMVVSQGESITLPAGDYWMSPWGGNPAFQAAATLVDVICWPRDNADGVTDSSHDQPGHDAWVASVTYYTNSPFSSDPCCSDNPPLSDPPQGEYCANLTRIAAPDGFPTDDSYWEMAGTYQLGTTQVWVDGLFLQQNVDYTEHPDQSFIQIDSSIAVESGGAFFGAEPGQKIVYACANYQSIYGLIA
jgi:hypothetical protein